MPWSDAIVAMRAGSDVNRPAERDRPRKYSRDTARENRPGTDHAGRVGDAMRNRLSLRQSVYLACLEMLTWRGGYGEGSTLVPIPYRSHTYQHDHKRKPLDHNANRTGTMTDTYQLETLTDLLVEAMATHYPDTIPTRCAGCGDPCPCLTHRLAEQLLARLELAHA